MPHAELKFSSDLDIDAEAVLKEIEQVILTHDGGAGACKGRAYPCDHFHHTHCLVELSLLSKPHRGAEFTKALLRDIEACLKRNLKQACALSYGIKYSDDYYVTGMHAPND